MQNNILREGLMQIAANYVMAFQQKPEQTLKMFCNYETPLEVMQSVYNSSVIEKELVPIEDLDYEVKVKLWKQAKETCPDADERKKVKLSRCIWLINFILEK